MITSVGVYRTRPDAVRGASKLVSSGIEKENVIILTPNSEAKEDEVPTIAGEQPGIVKAIGVIAGGAFGSGVLGGLATLFLPGVGPVMAIGIAGGALFGALAGGTLAGAAENTIFSGLPEEEMFVYKDALRQGRSVVVAIAKDKKQAEEARAKLNETGAESVDRARKMWWLGVRDVGKEHYQARGGSQENTADEESDRKTATPQSRK